MMVVDGASSELPPSELPPKNEPKDDTDDKHVPLFDDPERLEQEMAQMSYYWVFNESRRDKRLPVPFVYFNCLTETADKLLKSPDKIVRSIKFDIGRYYDSCTKTIKFKNPVTMNKAIRRVETYLNKKMDKKYWKKVENSAGGDSVREHSSGIQGVRGHAIGGAFFLEVIKQTSPGCFRLSCGS